MVKKGKVVHGMVLFIVTLAFAGCAQMESTEISQLQNQLNQKEQEIESLEASNKEKEMMLDKYKGKLDEESRATLEAEMRAKQAEETEDMIKPGASLLPPDAEPGECYARVFVPPTYQTVTEEVLKRGASERLEVIPAKYEWVEEEILVQEASSRLEIIPAEYGWVEEQVLVKAASTRMEQVPAEYEWQEEQVMVKPAHTVWKKGRGLIERVDNATGEIMCLVEIPATYKTVRKKVMVRPPTTREIEIPAVYDTVKKRVQIKPPSQRTIEIPAAYKTVKVRKLVSPPEEQRIPIPAEYETVTKTEMITDGQMEWRQVICETNLGPNIISKIQNALLMAGHDPGPIDGVMGPQTHRAVKSYQMEKNLATGGLTIKTIESLGIERY
jgi:cell division protein FtsB